MRSIEKSGVVEWTGLGAAALALIAMAAAAPAAAAEGDEASCRRECSEARRVCHAAAHAGYELCWDQCEQNVAAAVRRSRDLCDDRELSPRECARLAERALVRASRQCRDECRQTRTRSRRACREERHECSRVCAPPTDAACLGECRDEFGGCRDGLDACREGCSADAKAALEECRLQVGDRCDPEAFRECVHQVRSESRACADTCHEENACAGDLRQCLGECEEGAQAE